MNGDYVETQLFADTEGPHYFPKFYNCLLFVLFSSFTEAQYFWLPLP